MSWIYPNFVAGRGAVGLLLLRLVMGSAFVIHGWPKITHPFDWRDDPAIPGFAQALAALGEFGGGIALILGLLAPLGALGIASSMSGALTMVHFKNGDPFVAVHGGHSFELPALYLACAILVILIGPGTLSADWCLFGRRTPAPPPLPPSAV
jgi:putative oxidoreductase